MIIRNLPSSAILLILLSGCSGDSKEPGLVPSIGSIWACTVLLFEGPLAVPDDRADRFLGKVQENTARCRGGEAATEYQALHKPWVDWPGYWATGDQDSHLRKYDNTWFLGWLFEKTHLHPDSRGIDGALIDLEYERVELIKFNLFDNITFPTYIKGNGVHEGPVVKVWPELRLPDSHPEFAAVGAAATQECKGDLVRFRTLSGICNDTRNPLMGSANMPFARNVQFEETYPDLGLTELTKNRHGDRIGVMKPDPQLISRELFTRQDGDPVKGPGDCNAGLGLEDDSALAHCDYQKAPFFNVLAAFWIQFMTHDWFSHLREGSNQRGVLATAGCEPASSATGCRPDDQYEPALIRDAGDPGSFSHDGKQYQSRARKTFDNTVTAWWDASQIYGYDGISGTRVKRDGAKLAMDENGYLARFAAPCGEAAADNCDQIQTQWTGQEWSAFPDNWTLGMSFYHNIFAREHNLFVDEFRRRGSQTPDADTGLRHPNTPDRVITYSSITDEELFQVARLVVSAEIAKIHTIEWTTQLLYNDPLFRAMNSNWHGLLDGKSDRVKDVVRTIQSDLANSTEVKKANSWYSVIAAGPGIFGTGSRIAENGVDTWSVANADHVNGGTNHFGSPFNFPEEFPTVYRLHPLVPDLLELRRHEAPDQVVKKISAGKAFRQGASDIMQREGIDDWAISMGRQRLGLLHLNNHPRFLQNLPLPHLQSTSGKLDIAALDLIRDRERGVPRFNEFRRQYGLRQLTSFDDFLDQSLNPEFKKDPKLDPDGKEWQRQNAVVAKMRAIYGTHSCDELKIISHAQRDENGQYPNDCHGQKNGSMVDNIEDVDTVVGWLAEPVRPHGYAISETQFVVFILNASRRLFSDRFFTSSFRPEFYSTLGRDWVMNNGPDQLFEKQPVNGHKDQPVSPLKRVLWRTLPALREELNQVVNVFDPWTRDRGTYYSLDWKPRAGAENDVSYKD